VAASDSLEALVRRMPQKYRRVFTDVLGKLPEGVRTPELVRIALDANEADDMRSRAIWLLGRLADGEPAVAVVALLGDPSVAEDLRHDVAQALQYCEDDRAVTALHAVLARDVVPLVRCSAANALGFNPSTRAAFDDLVGILLDTTDDPEVRGYAAEALGHTFQMAVTPAAVKEALRTSVLDPDDTVRYEAAWALGQVGRVQDIGLLERVLAAEQARALPNAKIVEQAAESIAQLATRRRPRRA
jgi:HEAT repeat protein